VSPCGTLSRIIMILEALVNHCCKFNFCLFCCHIVLPFGSKNFIVARDNFINAENADEATKLLNHFGNC
jgi:hypothetical protein